MRRNNVLDILDITGDSGYCWRSWILLEILDIAGDPGYRWRSQRLIKSHPLPLASNGPSN
eukprot:1165448-Amorphochlora_amoeboformis.AAC.1